MQRTGKCITYARSLVVRYFYSTLVGERSIAISLSVCQSMSISLEPQDRSSRNFLCRPSVAVAPSSSGGGLAILCALPVLWMTSRLAVMGIWRCVEG